MYISTAGIAATVLIFFGLAGRLSCAAVELPRTLPPHPRILFSKADLEVIRERAGGSARAQFAALKSQAGDWLKRDIKLPPRGSQWYHWYSCPKHGARLRTEGATRHVCPVDGEVFSGYPYDDVVLASEHNGLAGAIRTLGIVYQVTEDKLYAQKAKEILLAYAAKYRDYPLHDIRGQAKIGGGKVCPQTLDESTWLITVVEGADCIWDTLTKAEQGEVTEWLLRPAMEVIRQHKMGIHNIQCWKNSAVGMTGLLLGDTELVDEALNGPSGYFKQMGQGVSADGPWFEGAWGYHFYTLSAVLHLTEAAFHSGIDLYGPELKRMFDAPLAMAMPNLALPAFNDSGEVNLTGNRTAYTTAFARYHDEAYLLICGGSSSAREGRGYRDAESALFYGNLPGPSRECVPVSRNFAASGNAILAVGVGKDATWLGMKYGPHGGGHGHPDKLNFVFYAMGEVVAPDPGTANYGVPLQSGWFRTTLAHNTLVVDQESQKAAEGKCLAFVATNGFSAVMAEAGAIYQGVRVVRTVALIGEKLVVCIDQVRADAPHVFDLVYHNRGRLADVPEATPFPVPDKPGYSYLRDTRSLRSSSGLQLAFDGEAGNPVRVSFAPGAETTYIVETGVGRHTEDRVPLVLARREGKEALFLWCISLGTPEAVKLEPEPVKVLKRGEGVAVAAVRAKLGQKTYVLVAVPESAEMVVGNARVEGKLAWLTQSAGGRMEPRCCTK